MHDVLKWLGGLNGNEAAIVTVVSILSPVATIVWRVVANVRKQRAADMKAADKPTVPQPHLAIPPPSTELIVLSERLRQIEREQDVTRLRLKYEDSLEDRQELRIEVEALQNALTTERAENALLRARLEHLEREHAAVTGIPTPLRPRRL